MKQPVLSVSFRWWRENHLRLLSDGKRSRRRRSCACDETDDETDGPRVNLGAEIEAFV